MGGFPAVFRAGGPPHEQMGRPFDAPVGRGGRRVHRALRLKMRPRGPAHAAVAVFVAAVSHEGAKLGRRLVWPEDDLTGRLPAVRPRGPLRRGARVYVRAGWEARYPARVRPGIFVRLGPRRPAALSARYPAARVGNPPENPRNAEVLLLRGRLVSDEMLELLPPGKIHGNVRGRRAVGGDDYPLLSDVPRLQYPTIARVFFVAHARAERGLFRGPGYVCVSVSIRAFKRHRHAFAGRRF